MILLVDQDNVLADFEAGFRTAWIASHPDISPVAEADRKSFQVRDDYAPELRRDVDAIIESRGFYRHLPPVPGAISALQELVDGGVDVYICTSPLSQYHNCVLEKYEWVEEHLGPEFTKRIILTRDKTLVRGDILVDDKPEIRGLATPTWQHILYDQPYNRRSPGPRMTWLNWRNLLRPYVIAGHESLVNRS